MIKSIRFDRVLFAAVFAVLALVYSPMATAQDESSGSPDNETATAEDGAPESDDDAESEDEGEKKEKEDSDSKVKAEPKTWVGKLNKNLEGVDRFFGKVNEVLGGAIFYPVPIPFTSKTIVKEVDGEKVEQEGNETIRLGVLVLIAGATFFTIKMAFINVRAFKHAILVTAGKYDNPEDEGEVTHFQALTAALSATVGLGNIGGVAAAVCLGGPGAVLWMIFAGFLGMTSKFVECTLGQKYREERPDGRVMGGAMYYLSKGLSEMGLAPLGKVLAVMFAVLCVGGSFGGGNSYQVNQSLAAVGAAFPIFAAPDDSPAASDTADSGDDAAAGEQTADSGSDTDYRWLYGLIMSGFVAVVIIGGIRRIASAAEKIVPTMCGIYVLAALIILLKNIDAVPDALIQIVKDAFTGTAIAGGFVGVLVQGFQRAAFSNEAGVGSAAIAHAAAKTEYPAREGVVALLGPFIDTIVICTMTALVIIITGAWDPQTHPEWEAERENPAALTAVAMDSEIPGIRYVLAVAVILFAFSTMISWSYYGERCWAYLFGDNSSKWYRIIFVIFTFLGSIISAKQVFEFGDLMIFGMAIPNIIGVMLLSGKVRKELNDYWGKLKAGEFKTVDAKSASDST